jgi:hypothetical protein
VQALLNQVALLIFTASSQVLQKLLVETLSLLMAITGTMRLRAQERLLFNKERLYRAIILSFQVAVVAVALALKAVVVERVVYAQQ